MGYVLETYAQRPGTTNRKRLNTTRPTSEAAAIRGAVALTERATGIVAVVAHTTRTSRTLIGTATAGTFTPATKHTTTEESTTMTETTDTTSTDDRFYLHGWTLQPNAVKVRKDYATEDGAVKAAARLLDTDSTVDNVTIMQAGSKRKVTVKRDADPTVSHIRKPFEAPTAPVQRAKGTQGTREPQVPAEDMTTWDVVLGLSDGQLERGFKGGRPALPLPMAQVAVDKLDTFDALYARFLAGVRQTGPSGPRYGLTTDEQKEKRAALRSKIARAAKAGRASTDLEPRRNAGRAAA